MNMEISNIILFIPDFKPFNFLRIEIRGLAKIKLQSGACSMINLGTKFYLCDINNFITFDYPYLGQSSLLNTPAK